MTYKLTPFPEDELPAFQSDMLALLDKHQAHLEPEPKFMKNTITGPDGQTQDMWNQVMSFVVYKKSDVTSKED